MAKYERVYDKSKIDWNNAYFKRYGKYEKASKVAWEQSGEGGGSEGVFMKITEFEEPKTKLESIDTPP